MTEKRKEKKGEDHPIFFCHFLSLAASGLGGLGPLQGAAVRGAADKLVVVVNYTLGKGSQALEGGSGQINLVGGTASTVVDDTNNDGATADGDLGALEASSLLTALVEPHGNGTNVPAISSIDVGVALQIAIASGLCCPTVKDLPKEGEGG